MFRKLILLAFVLALIAAFSNVASALPLIGEVVRSGGNSDTRDPIGTFTGNTPPLPTQAGGWTDGNYCFSDRTYTWANTPDEVDGAEYVRTFNTDKGSSVTYTVTFPIGATVLLTCDDRFSPPQDYVDNIVRDFAAPGEFTDTGWDVFVGGDGDPPGRQLSVYSAPMPPGTYVFHDPASGSNNFYIIGALDPPAPMRKAHSPDPAHESRTPPDGEEGDGYWMLLEFAAGYGATTHTAYFSEVEQDVIDRNPAVSLGSPPYPGVYPTGYYAGLDDENVPEFARTPLDRGVTYYWVVDESNDTAAYPGDVWSFTIASEAAYGPTPPDGAQYIDGASVDLAWQMGDVNPDDYIISYDVYWGTDEAAVAADDIPDDHVTDAMHTIGPLLDDQDYYWKVNTVLTDKGPPFQSRIVEGTVWHFKTKPFVEITDPTRIGWWKFDEDSGDVVLDHSGYDNDGTITGDAQRVPGKIDDAIDIDGNGQRVEIEFTAGVPTTVNPPEISFAMWVNPDIVTTSDEWSTLFYVSESGGYGKIRCNIWPDGRWAFRAGQGGTSDTNVDAIGPAAVIGEWAHYVGMKVDNDAAYVYIDGELGASTTFGIGGDLDPSCWIGAGDDSTNNLFNGQIDDVQVYLRALSLKEIKLMAGRLSATDPDPANGATDVSRTPTLSWSPGAFAASVNGNVVYYSEDLIAVINRTAPSATVSDPPYAVPMTLDMGASFYWAVDTVNGVEIWPGDVWTFTTVDWIYVDDMESYTPWTVAGNNIFEAYRDGMGNCSPGNGNGTGSNLTENAAPVFEGVKSMKYDYDNDGMVFNPCTMAQATRPYKYSKIEAQIATLYSGIGTDWTIQGVKALSLRFYGGALNGVEPLWVQLQDATKGYGAKVTYGDYEDEDPSAITEESWHEWFIDMADFDVDPTNLVSISIGFGNEDGSGDHGNGTVYFDAFRLYTPRCFAARHSEEMARVDFAPLGAPDCVVNYEELAVMTRDWLEGDYLRPVHPLIARWQLDGNYNDSSGHGNTATPVGAGMAFVTDPDRGQVLRLPGGDDIYADCGSVGISGADPRTIACWAKADSATIPDWTLIFGFTGMDDTSGGNGSHFNIGSLGGPGGIGAHCWGWEETIFSDEEGLEWRHYAMTYDGTTILYYGDGKLMDTDLAKSNVRPLVHADRVHIGSRITQLSSFPGSVDDACIFDVVLDEGEIGIVMAGGAATLDYHPLTSPANLVDGEGIYNLKVNFKDYAELLDSWLLEIKYPQ